MVSHQPRVSIGAEASELSELKRTSFPEAADPPTKGSSLQGPHVPAEPRGDHWAGPGYVEGTRDWRVEGKAVQATPQLGGPDRFQEHDMAGGVQQALLEEGHPKAQVA